jgi:predicted O-methyltransferase YrrM
MPGVLGDPKLEALLARLNAASENQDGAMGAFFGGLDQTPEPEGGRWPQIRAFLTDKFVALEPDKAAFCYLTCRALRARRVVEVGTSYGVSTLWLAKAVKDNGGGVVIGTEYEPGKAKVARANFAEAGLADVIELREGDARETLKSLEGPIDFVLMDIWGDIPRPTIELIAPHLRMGAVICADNTGGERSEEYARYFAFVNDPKNGLSTMTLPFKGGFEFTVKIA